MIQTSGIYLSNAEDGQRKRRISLSNGDHKSIRFHSTDGDFPPLINDYVSFVSVLLTYRRRDAVAFRRSTNRDLSKFSVLIPASHSPSRMNNRCILRGGEEGGGGLVAFDFTKCTLHVQTLIAVFSFRWLQFLSRATSPVSWVPSSPLRPPPNPRTSPQSTSVSI